MGEELEESSEATVAKLPKLESIKRTIRRERQVAETVPVQPDSLQDLVILPEYTLTAKGIIFYCTIQDLDRFDFSYLVRTNIDLLTASQIRIANGTFKTAPPLFAQV